MNKNIEAAAVEYALDKISVKCPACGMDSLWNNHSNDFKSGAEWALREAIEICNNDSGMVDSLPSPYNTIVKLYIMAVKNDLQQLLSSEDKNDKP